jgi:hypothetical protein
MIDIAAHVRINYNMIDTGVHLETLGESAV